MSDLTPSMISIIKHALKEDIGSGDVTTNSIVPLNAVMSGEIISKQAGVISGLDVARAVYRLLDEKVQFESFVEDGAKVENKQKLVEITGSARILLTAERTALNFLGRMSGISTLTNRFVQAVAGTKAQILDTRKTAPGLRDFDKMAVRLGGGTNHRVGLYDMILIKDNHIDFAGSMEEAVQLARSAKTNLEIEVEARTLADVSAALALKVERILLDNMSCEMMSQAVDMSAGRAKLEASGNITLETVRQVAETGVDYISTGAVTHSVMTFDVSFNYLEKQR